MSPYGVTTPGSGSCNTLPYNSGAVNLEVIVGKRIHNREWWVYSAGIHPWATAAHINRTMKIWVSGTRVTNAKSLLTKSF